MNAPHLNLLNPLERRSASPVRARIILPVIAGCVMAFVLLWGGFVGVQYAIIRGKIRATKAEIALKSSEMVKCNLLKTQLANLQAESDQYAFYMHAREKRGELLKKIAYAVPEGVTLTSLVIPPPPEQMLKRPFGSKLPPLQGPTQSVERVELRLTGVAREEQDLFQLMEAMEGNSFTGLVRVVKHPAPGERESPRVLEFRQEAPAEGAARRGVYFDVVYDIASREFVK